MERGQFSNAVDICRTAGWNAPGAFATASSAALWREDRRNALREKQVRALRDSSRDPTGRRDPTLILRLRYQGSADRWAIGIYKASSGQYSESELPGSFGPATGTPEQGLDDTFILDAGPQQGTDRAHRDTGTRHTEKCESRV